MPLLMAAIHTYDPPTDSPRGRHRSSGPVGTSSRVGPPVRSCIRETERAVNAGGAISGPTPGRFTITNVPLRFIILDAFALRDHQLIDAPEWTSSAAYDITAKYPEGSKPTQQEIRAMMQALLADRFGLKVRRELPSYDLVLSRRDGALGPQLTRSDVDCEQWLAGKRPQLGAGGPSPVMPTGLRPACVSGASNIAGGHPRCASSTPPSWC
jgi:hypothetical protein